MNDVHEGMRQLLNPPRDARAFLDLMVNVSRLEQMNGRTIFYGEGRTGLADRDIRAVIDDAAEEFFPLDPTRLLKLLSRVHNQAYTRIEFNRTIAEELVRSTSRVVVMSLDPHAHFGIHQLNADTFKRILADIAYDYRHITNYYPHLIVDGVMRFSVGYYGMVLTEIPANADTFLRESMARDNPDLLAAGQDHLGNNDGQGI